MSREDLIEAHQKHLESTPKGAPEDMTHQQMYEMSIDAMIGAQSVVGCSAWKDTPAAQRMAISADATMRTFDKQDMLYLLTAALDRLVTLALDGHPVYWHDGEGLPEPPR